MTYQSTMRTPTHIYNHEGHTCSAMFLPKMVHLTSVRDWSDAVRAYERACQVLGIEVQKIYPVTSRHTIVEGDRYLIRTERTYATA